MSRTVEESRLVYEALMAAHAGAEADLKMLFAPYIKQAEKLGFRAFLRIEPELVVANGETLYARCVEVELRPVTRKAQATLKYAHKATAIKATDKYVELDDAEYCMAGVLEAAIEQARQAIA